MKKLIMSLACIGLLTNGMASAVMSPKRLWHCITTPKDCNEKERKEARAWIIGGSITALVAALTAFGIIRGPHIVREAKIKAIEDEITDTKIDKSRADDPAEFRRLAAREQELRALKSQIMSEKGS